MLQNFRSQSNSIFIYAVFGAIIVTFIFAFGTQPESCSVSSDDDIVRVGSHRIDRIEFANLMRLAQGRFGRMRYDFNPQSAEVRLTAATNIGLILHIADLAEEAGLRVSDDELAAYIQGEQQCNPDTILYITGGQIDRRISDPAYQGLGRWPELRSCITGGAFDEEAYKRMLEDYNLSPVRYESFKRRELLALNYLSLLDQSVTVPEHEVRRVFEDNSTALTLRYARVTSASVAHLVPAVDDAAIDDFIANRAAELQTYFDAHKADYSKPSRVDLSVIVVQKTLPESLPLLTAGLALDRNQSAQARFAIVKDKVLVQKLPFEEVAKLHNETIIEDQYNKSGRAGWSNYPGSVSAERQAALKDAKPGDIVEVEEASYLSLIRLEAREEGYEKALSDVQRDIARILIEKERRDKKRDEVAKQVHERAKAGVPLQEALDEAMLYAAMVEPAPTPAPAPIPEPSPVVDPTAPVVDPTAPPVDPTAPPVDPTAPPVDPTAPAPTPAPAPAPTPAEVMAPQVPFVPPAQRVMVEDSKPATPRALPQLPPQLRGMDIPPDLMDQLLYEQSANPFGVGASRALVRDALAMKAPGEVAPKLYALDDAQLVVTLGSKEAGAEELFNEQRPLIVESLRRAYVQMMIGQWYQVIDLRHPTPASAPAPYGAWLGAAYQEASDKRMRLHPSLIDAVQKSRQAVDPGT